jgi:hypothetical protein
MSPIAAIIAWAMVAPTPGDKTSGQRDLAALHASLLWRLGGAEIQNAHGPSATPDACTRREARYCSIVLVAHGDFEQRKSRHQSS